MTTGIYPRWPFPDRLATFEEAAVHLSESSSGARQAYDRWNGRTRLGWRLRYLARPLQSDHGAPGLGAVQAFWRARRGPAESFLMPSFGYEAMLASHVQSGSATLVVRPYAVVTSAALPFSALKFNVASDENDCVVINEASDLASDSDVTVTVPAGTYYGFTGLSQTLQERLNGAALTGAYSVSASVTERRFEISSTVTFGLIGRLRDGNSFGHPDPQSVLGTLGFRNTENRTGERRYLGRRSVTRYGNVAGLFEPHPSRQNEYGLCVITTVAGNELGIDPLPTLPTIFGSGALVEPVVGAAFMGMRRTGLHVPPNQYSYEVMIREALME